MKQKLPEFVQYKHGSYWYVRWNPSTKKVVWTVLGKTYPEMLKALSGHLSNQPILMREVLARYLNEVIPTKKRSTQKNQTYQLNKLVEHFGNDYPAKITTQQIYKFHDMRSTTSPSSANKEMSLLSNVFKHALKWGVVSINPAINMIRNKEKPRKRYVTHPEFDLLLHRTTGFLHDAIELAYISGQRIGDVLKMQWSDIAAKRLHVIQEKGGEELFLKLTPGLSAIIRRCKSKPVVGRTIICDRNGQQIRYGRLRKRLVKVVDKLVESGELASQINLHDIRRKAGSDLPLESGLLGNTLQTRERVYHVAPKVVTPVR